MTHVLVHHQVADYAKWKIIYDEHAATRKAGGSKGARLLRNANDPNDLVVITEWNSMEDAQAFAQSPDLRETMQRAGVMGMPEVMFLEDVQWTPA